jgi:RNA polymerase-binding transcription factor DksA
MSDETVLLLYEDSIIKNRSLAKERDSLKLENQTLKSILINDYGACPECVDAVLAGYTICGDCYS